MSSNMENFSIRSPINQNGGFELFGFSLFEDCNNITRIILAALNDSRPDIAVYHLKIEEQNKFKDIKFSCKNKMKQNILHMLAKYTFDPNIIELFKSILNSNLNLKSALNCQDNDMNTPVHILFSMTGNNDLINLCERKGADLTMQNKSKISIVTKGTEKDRSEKHMLGSEKYMPKHMTMNNDNDYSIFNKKTESDRSMKSETSTNVKALNNIANANMIKPLSVGGSYDSQEIIDMLMNTQTGGRKNAKTTMTGTRHINTYSEFSGGSPKSSRRMVNRLTRSVENKSEQLHTAALEKIKSILKDLEPKLKGDELTLKARAYKAIIYSQVKEKNQTASNFEKATELEKQVTEENIKNIKKNEASRIEEITNHISEKDKLRSEKMSSDSSKTATNSEKKNKKSSKKSKDTTEMTGGFLSDSEFSVNNDKVYSVIDFSD